MVCVIIQKRCMEAEADEPDEKKNKSRVKVAIRVRPMIAKEKIDG